MGVSLFRDDAPNDFGVFTLGLYSMFRLTAGETQVRSASSQAASAPLTGKAEDGLCLCPIQVSFPLLTLIYCNVAHWSRPSCLCHSDFSSAPARHAIYHEFHHITRNNIIFLIHKKCTAQ